MQFLKLLVFSYLLLFELQAFTLQQAQKYSDQNISGWVMSEKLDGIRAYWDGKKLQTRKGEEIHAPAWFIKNLPPFELDGELWTKRGDFENIQSIVMDEIPHLQKWGEIHYMLFEVPHAKGDFHIRLQKAAEFIDANHLKHLRIIEQIPCKNQTQLDGYLESILAHGGEGVMVKDGSKEYFEGRSSSILKVKKADDMEAKVIGYKKGKPKFASYLHERKD